MEDCLICKRIALIKENKNKFLVRELTSGYVVLGDQYKDRTQFLEDMALVSEAVYKSFKPRKLNYELLGNTDSHLHWHIFPRYENDTKPDVPVWIIPASIRSSGKTIPTEIEIKSLKEKLLAEIDELLRVKV